MRRRTERETETIAAAVRAGWSMWTADPVGHGGWSPQNPAWSQCAGTALVVQDHLGGELLLALVISAEGADAGLHYWNRLPGGRELDLTREQFRDGERVGPSRRIDRPADVTRGRLAGNYHLLAARVARTLATGEPPRGPVSVKAVCRDPAGRVLLCRSQRGDWELPGGRPEPGETFAGTVVRELAEETGLRVLPDRVIGVEQIEVIPGGWVEIVALACALDSSGEDAIAPRASPEHTTVAFLDPDALTDAELPAPYRALILRSWSYSATPSPSYSHGYGRSSSQSPSHGYGRSPSPTPSHGYGRSPRQSHSHGHGRSPRQSRVLTEAPPR